MDGTLLISVAGGTTGIVEDITHSDTLVAGDLVCCEIETGGGTGTITVLELGAEIDSGNKFEMGNSLAAGVTHAAGATVYHNPYGIKPASLTTEAHAQQRCPFPFIASNLRLYIKSNGTTGGGGTSTYQLRINGVNGNQVISIPAGTTGWVYDNVNTDEIAGNDLLSAQLIVGTGGDIVTTAGLITGRIGGVALALSISDSFAVADALGNAPGKNVSDSFLLADVKALAVTKVLSDGVTLADALALNSGKYLLDSFAVADVLGNTPGKTLSDSFVLSDSKVLQLAKMLSDTFALSDTVQAVITLILTLSDSFSLSDTLTKSLAKVLLDSLGITDALTKQFGKNVVDLITLGDLLDIVGGSLAATGGPTTLHIAATGNYFEASTSNSLDFSESNNFFTA